MEYKTVSTVILRQEMLDHVLENAGIVAEAAGAHLDVICLGVDQTRPDFYYAGASAVMLQDNLAQARDRAEALESAARARLANAAFKWSVAAITTQTATLNALVAHRTRFSDLVILPRPYGENRGHEHEAVLEAALFNGEVPVLVLPDDRQMPDAIENVVVAWNDSSEALRSCRAALPFLKAAESVCITIIDPPTHGPERSDPGGGLSQWMARHGVRAEVSVLARTMPRISDVLNRHVTDKAAGLVVMGAYGHSRFREAIMGGATRHMLEVANVPVLMMH